jgi:hypothetical protein
MSIGFVTKTIHAYLDYPVAFGLILFPFVLGLGAGAPLALWLSVATGIAALVLTLFTDHHLGVFRILPYKLHMAVDLAVGLMFIVAPFAFGFSGIDAAFYWINGLAVVSVISLHKADPEGQMS